MKDSKLLEGDSVQEIGKLVKDYLNRGYNKQEAYGLNGKHYCWVVYSNNSSDKKDKEKTFSAEEARMMEWQTALYFIGKNQWTAAAEHIDFEVDVLKDVLKRVIYKEDLKGLKTEYLNDYGLSISTVKKLVKRFAVERIVDEGLESAADYFDVSSEDLSKRYCMSISLDYGKETAAKYLSLKTSELEELLKDDAKKLIKICGLDEAAYFLGVNEKELAAQYTDETILDAEITDEIVVPDAQDKI